MFHIQGHPQDNAANMRHMFMPWLLVTLLNIKAGLPLQII